MTTIIDTFQKFSNILVVCPRCQEIVRLSDLSLRIGGKGARTFLDDLRDQERSLRSASQALVKKKTAFHEKEQELRSAAIEQGRRRAKRLLKKIDPSIAALRYDPSDIKTIGYPSDLVVFDGLAKGDRIKKIVFVVRHRDVRKYGKSFRDLRNTIRYRKYIWETVRICADGSLEVK